MLRVEISTGVALAELELDFEEWTRFGKLKRKEESISFKFLAQEQMGRLVSTACSEDGDRPRRS